ncbi:hypothetical protein BHE90_005170 [Fusarium euwallaceae]|uniref:Uncharacterized protein n=3 Tax=Fusarium solani species complex TaxID=232080 RepID=A0A3M2SGM4_9HYPO|nr:hypothetical protein CDV36_003592 [Fusarium kuroshium]RSL85379.1 hypothetical protein CEP51_003360 [Fusarium floridanum]RTE80343.1 hypothetical protein BHE90_005170 [Fusarium euwallaceae]
MNGDIVSNLADQITRRAPSVSTSRPVPHFLCPPSSSSHQQTSLRLEYSALLPTHSAENFITQFAGGAIASPAAC